MALLPVLVLVLGAGIGLQHWRGHQAEKAVIYQQAEAALAAGDFDAAELSFTALGEYRDSGDRLSEVQTVAEPVRDALDEAIATLDSGDYANAIVMLEAIVSQAPGFGLAQDLLASSRSARIEHLTQQAVTADANRDWLRAELAFRELILLQPDDAALAERLELLVRDHAPIAFTRGGAVFIAGPNGEDERALTPAMGAIFPSWSPDRSQIAFVATTEGDDRFRGTLMLMDGDGNNLRPIAEDVLPYAWPVWSPDGRGIAFTSIHAFDIENYTGSISLNVYEVETGIERDLTGDQLAHAAVPTWSPDGTQIAFVSNTIHRRGQGGIDLQDGDVYVVPANGGAVRDLTRSRVSDESWVQWSPAGGRLLIFTAPGDWSMPAMSRLFLLDLTSEALSEIVIDEWQTSLPFWSPDGSRIAYVTGGDTVNVWSDQGLQWIQLGTDVSSFLSWSPDGDYLLVPAANDSMPSFVVDAFDRFGALRPFELDYDDSRSGNGPPVWGGFTPPVGANA
jgi:Tol biopolymer transport system component